MSNSSKIKAFFKGLDEKISKLLSAITILFCFFIFPTIIVYSLLDKQFVISSGYQRTQSIDTMKKQLEYIEKYSTNNKYFHFLLSEIVENANSSSDPKEHLKKNLENLHKQYPKEFEFVTWDSKGKVIRELTDIKAYFYAMRKVYEVFYDVVDGLANDPDFNINTLKSATNNLNILRQFLGKILLLEDLKKPYQRGDDAGALLSDSSSKHNSIWYKIGPEISLLCFMSEELMNSNVPLTKIIDSLNKKDKSFIYGYSIADNYTSPITPVPLEYKKSLTMALATFEKSNNAIFENDSVIITLSMPRPELRCFAIFPKTQKVWSLELQRNIKFTQAMFLLILLYLTIFLLLNFKTKFVSISIKVTSLFFLVNIVPLAILSFLAYGFLNSASEAMYDETAAIMSHSFKSFDNKYESLKHEYSVAISEELDAMNEEMGNKEITKDYIDRIDAITKEFSVGEAILINAKGELLYSYKERTSAVNFDMGFYRAFGLAVLNFSNNHPFYISNDYYRQILEPESSDLIRSSFKFTKQIGDFVLGSVRKNSYSYIFGDPKAFDNKYFLYFMWDKALFQNMCLEKYYSKSDKNNENIKLYATTQDGQRVWPEKDEISDVVLDHMINLNRFSEAKVLTLDIEAEPHIALINTGNNLESIIFGATYPIRLLNGRINNMRAFIFVCILISMFLTTVLGRILSKQFITPINNLRAATIAVGQQKFSHRIPILDRDEFGKLNQIFNRVIEGLEDFETAKVVQESLLPGNSFKIGNLNVYAENIVMTTLGGDYYDIVPIDDEMYGILIGDVAGHGVGAGLMMAMAKASVMTTTKEEKLDPSAIAARLHKMFYSIKNDRLKKMMTFQYFAVNSVTAQFTFTNAGHCFPIIIDSEKKTAEFIEHIAMPLGIGRRARYKNLDFELAPGNSLILYTDGIAEAKNIHDEDYGFKSMEQVFPTLYNEDPQKFYENIYDEYTNWSEVPDDDFTLMVINNDS